MALIIAFVALSLVFGGAANRVITGDWIIEHGILAMLAIFALRLVLASYIVQGATIVCLLAIPTTLLDVRMMVNLAPARNTDSKTD